MVAVVSLAARGRHCAPGRHDEGHPAVHQVGRQLGQLRELTVRPTVLDRDVAAFDIAAFAQTLAEGIREPHERARRCAVEKADQWDSWVRIQATQTPKKNRARPRTPARRILCDQHRRTVAYSVPN
jgi:hypothetical protein